MNRALVRGHDDPGHITLVTGQDQDFIGAYRLDGWGWLWRIGGFYPHPNVALPVAAAAMEYLYTHAPPPTGKPRLPAPWGPTASHCQRPPSWLTAEWNECPPVSHHQPP